MTCIARCSYRCGSSGIRILRTEEEAQTLLIGGHNVNAVHLENDCGETIGARKRHPGCADKRVKWLWFYDKELLEASL